MNYIKLQTVAAVLLLWLLATSLEDELKFSGLSLDLTKYKKYASPENPNFVSYSNYADGIAYTVDKKNDDVISIDYMPTTEDCKNLKRRTNKRQVLWRPPLKGSVARMGSEQ